MAAIVCRGSRDNEAREVEAGTYLSGYHNPPSACTSLTEFRESGPISGNHSETEISRLPVPPMYVGKGFVDGVPIKIIDYADRSVCPSTRQPA
jgi:hypothetical protein